MTNKGAKIVELRLATILAQFPHALEEYREEFVDEKSEPITDDKNFPTDLKNLANEINQTSSAYHTGYVDGYHNCLVLFLGTFLMGLIIMRFCGPSN